MLDLVNADGSFGCDLRYQGYEICDGKYNLKGLPAVYLAEEEAQTLIIYMKDQVTGLQVELLYGVLPEYDVITRSAKVINTEEDKIRLTKAQAACIDFLHGEFDVISFYGRHAMERNMQRTSVGHGAFCNWKPQRNIQPSVQSDDDTGRKRNDRRCRYLLWNVFCIQRRI